MTGTERLLRFARAVLGAGVTPADGCPTNRQRRLLRIRDAKRRESYVAKLHATREKHDREVRAYERWVHELGERAPRLVAADAALGAILITAVPGSPANGMVSTAVHREAGAALRLLHAAEVASSPAEAHRRLVQRMEHWLARARGVLSVAEATVATNLVAELAGLEGLDAVACHLDYQPRNWLVDDAGALRIVDFEHARVDLRVRDFVRLELRHWRAQPELRRAFFDGYGRALTDVEQEAVVRCGAIDAVTALVRAEETGDPALAAHGRAALRQLA